MKVTLEINNISKSPIKKRFFLNVAEETLRAAAIKPLSGKEISLSIALIEKKEMRKINRRLRKNDSITDVLSFSEYSSTKKITAEKAKTIFLGEIILCYNYIADYAREKSVNIDQELAKVFSHGVLHLLGLKHGKRMFSIQEQVVKTKHL